MMPQMWAAVLNACILRQRPAKRPKTPMTILVNNQGWFLSLLQCLYSCTQKEDSKGPILSACCAELATQWDQI